MKADRHIVIKDSFLMLFEYGPTAQCGQKSNPVELKRVAEFSVIPRLSEQSLPVGFYLPFPKAVPIFYLNSGFAGGSSVCA